MKNVFTTKYPNAVLLQRYIIVTMMTLLGVTTQMNAQCVPSSGTIEGVVFHDANNDGKRAASETGKSGIVVTVTSSNGLLLGTSVTNSDGIYRIDGLNDGDRVRLVFQNNSEFYPSLMGIDNGTNVQMVTIPSCDNNYGLTYDGDLCNEKTEIVTTCFVQGSTSEHTMEPTIVGIEYGFTSSTPARKFAAHGETGSIWGIAWKSSTSEIFTSSFVKQHSGLKAGHDAIFVTRKSGTMHATEVFAKLSQLGIDVSDLEVTDPRDCNYGKVVGKMGLGALVISPDEKYLYVVDIENHQIVRILTVNPTIGNTVTFPIPSVGLKSYPFALKYHDDALYIGVTSPGKGGHVFKMDPINGDTEQIDIEVPVLNDWVDNPRVGGVPSLWLTDLDFTDEGHMLISLTDRIGHIYCNQFASRLDEQKGDLYIAFKNGEGWILEDRTNGNVFFNEAYWTVNPSYHPKITTGSIFALPGTQSVVSTVFDPESNSYSGGLQRYSTENGKRIGSKELYSLSTVVNFGKAVGFGDIVATCGFPKLEIGNLVWLDSNNNGVQDADEKGLAGVPLVLYDADCNVLASTQTDVNGYYAFNADNVSKGIHPNTLYYVGIDDSAFDEETEKYIMDGNLYVPTIIETNPLINSKLFDVVCDKRIVSVNVQNTSHNFDIGLITVVDCELKITQRVSNTNFLTVDDVVDFEITIDNQGSQAVQSVCIEKVLPEVYTFSESLNPGWILDRNILKRIFDNRIAIGGQLVSTLKLKFNKKSKSQNYETEVYIACAKDGFGQDLDIKSCFVSDEDQWSKATPEICDLALRHTVSPSNITLPNRNVVFTTMVCNQGTMDAEVFEIVNYLNAEFDFDPAINEGWEINQELTELTYLDDSGLKPKTCTDVKLRLSLKEDADVREIVNIAEISMGQCVGSAVTAYDFDSTFDKNPSNDRGGRPNTETDDMMDDKGEIDEDDHDPAVVRVNLVDLSIRKYVVNRNVNRGDYITFYLEVTNVGLEPVSKFVLADFLPEYTDLVDSTWSLENGIARKEFEFPGGFQPQSQYTATIDCHIRPDARHPYTLSNRILIENIYDLNEKDIKDLSGNLIEGLPQTNPLFEDDEDFTFVVISYPPELEVCSDCIPGTNRTNGQFILNAKIASGPDEDWYIESSIGLFDFDLSTVENPIAIPNASSADTFFLSTIAFPDDLTHTYYQLRALHIDKEGFYLVLRNKYGALEIIDVPPRTCSFESMTVSGPASLCTGSLGRYTISSSLGASVSYTWYVNDDVIPGAAGMAVDIDWASYGNGVFILKAVANSGCMAPAELRVAVGPAEAGSIACVGDFQVSLDGRCEMMITPQMLVADSLNPNAPYSVMLKDLHGNIISNATLTQEHIGKTIMAKLVEECGGNACWSNIAVEDKTPPRSLCQPNITIPCMFLNDYTGPFESDNCGGPIVNEIVREDVTPVCDGNVIRYIDRVYQATDARGNKSAFCEFRITVTRPDFSEAAGFLVFPKDLSLGNALLCSEFETDQRGNPHPNVSGTPTYAGRSIFPVVDNGCNTSVWYTDQILQFGCTTKVMRTWHVYESCGSITQYRTHLQTIEITDNKPPYVEPYANVSLSTNGRSCVGVYVIPMPVVVDTCSPYVVVDVTYPGGFIRDMKQATPISLSVSEVPHIVSVRVTDACGNSTTVSFNITVTDITPPVAVCHGETVVGLSSLGEAYVKASSFDDGSYDDCTITKMLVRRMDEKPCGDCEVPAIDGFTYLGEYTNSGDNSPHYYYLSRHKSHPNLAFKMADAVGGYMVSINSAQENTWVQNAISPWLSGQDYLIGLRDIKFKNEYTWASNQTLTYTNWGVGSPAANTPYVRVNNSNGQWTSFNNNEEYWYVVEITDPCGFANDVKFCCSDVSEPQTVVLRVIDKSGNWNECMVTAEVQDKFRPEIVCPDDTEIDCSIVVSGMDLSPYGMATAIDGCGATVRELTPVFDLSACRTGTITRLFEATDGKNPVTCTQRIYVGNSNSFNPSTDITWPEDFIAVNICGTEDLSPENLPSINGEPILRQAACGLAASFHRDRVFDFVTDACFKIVRTWTVIDWCEMERLGDDYVPTEYQQTIKVLNDIPPTVTSNIVQDTLFLTENGNCDEGRVNLNATAIDDCTSNNRMRWRVRVDLNSNNSYDITRQGTGSMALFNEVVPVGMHIIQWIFEDRCGNITVREQRIIVRNNDAPVANGLECVAVAINPWDTNGDGIADIEKGCITASTLNVSSYSPCCNANELRYSFSADINDTERCFDCLDVGENIFVELWVHDCNGNTDFVRVCVDVQDNNDSDVCEKLCILNPAVAEIMGETTICNGAQTTLTASGGEIYLWSTGETTPSIIVSGSSTTTYSVTVTNRFRCEDDASVVVNVSLPQGGILGDNLCLGESTTLTATGGIVFEWSTGETSNSIVVDPVQNTNYSVTVTNAIGCSSAFTRLVIVHPLPDVIISGNNNICLNELTTLVASGGIGYFWSTGETTSFITVNPAQTTTYTVTATDANGCNALGQRTVNVSGIANVAQINAQPAAICLGQSSLLSASLQGGTALSYLWSTGATTASISVSPASTTSYGVTITDTNGCLAQASRVVTVNPLPNAAITGQNICIGQSGTLTASGGVSYAWSNGATTAAITVSPIVNTTYTVTVTNSQGCTSTATRLLQVFPLPNAQVSPANVNICLNDNVNLTASGGTSYVWSTGATTATINVSPVATTTYTVTVTNANNCVATSSRSVVVSGIGAQANIQGTTPICLGESSTLTANLIGGTPLSYIWSTGVTTSSIVVSPNTTTTYSVTITDTNGCNANTSFTVNVNLLPSASIVGDNICLGETATLTASGGVSYAWSNGANSASITVSPNTNTVYTVTVTDVQGCTASATRLLEVFPLPNAQISPANANICLNESIDLTASGGISYEWNTGETSATISVSPITTTTYTVTVTSANNCTATASRIVVVNGLGSFANIQGNSPICINDSSTLIATLSGANASSFNWSNGAITSSIIVAPSSTTTYSVTITDTNGCNASASFTVTVNPLPLVSIDGDDVCPGDATVLTANGGVSYIWSTNETTSEITVSPATSTTYTVTGTDSNGCENTAEITIDILPVPSVLITGRDTICVDDTTILTASGGVSYVWSNGETVNEISVSPTTTTVYTVTVTGDNGCTNSASIEVFTNPNPEPIITGDLMICVGDTAFLSVSPGVSFEWSTSETTQSISVIPSTNTSYSVTVTDENGCVGSSSATVFVDQGGVICETQDITVYLPQSGMVTIDVQDISIGSLGACSSVDAFLDRTFFACNDISNSPFIVTLTVINVNTMDTLTCTAEVTVLDTLPPTITCPNNLTINCQVFDPNAPFSTYGNLSFFDNCPLGLTVEEIPVVDLNICNDGLITRTFTVTDVSGNSSQCVQSITIVNPTPFSEAAITWPSDVTVSNCDDVSTDSLGDIVINDNLYDCALLTLSNEDDIPSGTLCGGIYNRTFTVVDACTNQTYTNTQIITVIVEVPLITIDTNYFCIFRDTMTCLAEFENSSNISVSGCNLTLSGSITYPDNTIVTLTNFDLDGEYPDGITSITLIATESCTNLTDTLNFEIEVKGVETSIVCEKTYPEMPDILEVHESVYDHVEIVQGCDLTGTIVASYSNVNIFDTTAVYTCDDLPSAPIGLTIYFWIEGASAPFTLCQSLVGLTDPNDFCPPIRPSVAGNVHTESMVFVPDVEIDLDGSGMLPISTDDSGNYAFPAMDRGGEYMVEPKKDIKPLDGVSTLDLIFIQKHILGDRLLTSPYKMIAADINRDNRITASDIVELRKLILGIYDKFPANNSWRMVDEAYVFPDPKNPFSAPFAEEYHISQLNKSMNINWIGVKIGDVNDSYRPNLDDQRSTSRARDLFLTIPSIELSSGMNSIPVRVSESSDINGFQISLPISGAQNIRLSAGVLDIHSRNYTYENGMLHISWSQDRAQPVSVDDVLFNIEVDMYRNDKLTDVLLVDESAGLIPEYYTDLLETKSLGWRVNTKIGTDFALYGNIPNPWKNETSINFHLPESGNVSLRIRDIPGRVVYQNSNYFQAGDNSFKISNDILEMSGILIYDVTFKNEVKTKKMLNIK